MAGIGATRTSGVLVVAAPQATEATAMRGKSLRAAVRRMGPL